MRTADKHRGSHESLAREEHIKSSTDRGFGIVFAVVFGIIGAASWYSQGQHWPWWLSGSAAFAVIALTVPWLLAPLNRAWTKFGMLLFTVISPVALGIVFYVCVVPIGLLLRLTGKDLLSLKWKAGTDSYWIVRSPPGPKPESLRDQF